MADADKVHICRGPLVAAMPENWYPVQWAGRQAVVTLPENIDSSNADQVREQLLRVINRGAAVLIADLTGTISCDYSGADALARAYHRAVANGTQLRLVVTTESSNSPPRAASSAIIAVLGSPCTSRRSPPAATAPSRVG